jgi:hypothetical protein
MGGWDLHRGVVAARWRVGAEIWSCSSVIYLGWRREQARAGLRARESRYSTVLNL